MEKKLISGLCLRLHRMISAFNRALGRSSESSRGKLLPLLACTSGTSMRLTCIFAFESLT